MPEPWRPNVVQRDHPFGEAGVRSSLDEVAKAVSRGATSPKVRTWSIAQISDARKRGQRVNGDRARAEILLRAIQQKKTWVPDPTGAEFIAEAHLLACDESTEDAICIKGGDCDDVATVLGACFMSVGLYTLVVGHGYKNNQIQHVLCAVRVDGRWEYADPSYDMPLGTCAKFERERIIAVPNLKVLCDDQSCLRVDPSRWDPEREGFVERGVFVGVGGVVEKSPVTFTWLSAVCAPFELPPMPEFSPSNLPADKESERRWKEMEEQWSKVPIIGPTYAKLLRGIADAIGFAESTAARDADDMRRYDAWNAAIREAGYQILARVQEARDALIMQHGRSAVDAVLDPTPEIITWQSTRTGVPEHTQDPWWTRAGWDQWEIILIKSPPLPDPTKVDWRKYETARGEARTRTVRIRAQESATRLFNAATALDPNACSLTVLPLTHKPAKKSSALPKVAGAAVVAGVVWWLFL